MVFDARDVQHAECLEHLLGGESLFSLRQDRIRPGFHADVQRLQSQGDKHIQFLCAFGQHVVGARVCGKRAHAGHLRPNLPQNMRQPVAGKRKRIAAEQEYPVRFGKQARKSLDVPGDALVAVNAKIIARKIAKRALCPAASERYFERGAVLFPGRDINRVVTVDFLRHAGFLSISADILRTACDRGFSLIVSGARRSPFSACASPPVPSRTCTRGSCAYACHCRGQTPSRRTDPDAPF